MGVARRAWSDEDKAAALELLGDQSRSLYEINRETGVAVSTLSTWAKDAGIERSSAQTRAATAERLNRIAEKRAALAESFLDYAIDLAAESHVVGTEGLEREVAEGSLVRIASAQDSQRLMTAAAIAHDKFRLEMGESTSVIENRDGGARSKLEERLDEVARKRSERQAS